MVPKIRLGYFFATKFSYLRLALTPTCLFPKNSSLILETVVDSCSKFTCRNTPLAPLTRPSSTPTLEVIIYLMPSLKMIFVGNPLVSFTSFFLIDSKSLCLVGSDTFLSQSFHACTPKNTGAERAGCRRPAPATWPIMLVNCKRLAVMIEWVRCLCLAPHGLKTIGMNQKVGNATLKS